MEKLSKSASGLRHLRWSREILASLEAHYEHNPRLSQVKRDAVLDEVVKLRTLIGALSATVKPYRDFLERRRVQFRGMQRVGSFLCDSARTRAREGLVPFGADGLLATDRTRRSHRLPEGPRGNIEVTREAAQALRSISETVPEVVEFADELTESAAIFEGFNEAFTNMETREQLPLRTALESAIDALRIGLEQMDQRLTKALSQTFVDSLYPALAREGTIVADEGDSNDDAAARR